MVLVRRGTVVWGLWASAIPRQFRASKAQLVAVRGRTPEAESSRRSRMTPLTRIEMLVLDAVEASLEATLWAMSVR
jgi:hypothetical protein